MPVGTYGTVKAMAPDELERLGAQIMLGKTFHLWLRPGARRDRRAPRRLHSLMGWRSPRAPGSRGRGEKVFPRTICAPTSASSFGAIALTVP